MKKLIFTIFFLFCTSLSYATTYYVRGDGGTTAQCDGTHDTAQAGAVDSGDAGTLPDCALSHPAWALGGGADFGSPGDTTSGIMISGDTLIISQEAYKIGFGMPNTNSCAINWTYACVLNAPPAGTLSNHTKIYGKGYDTGCTNYKGTMAQLWGTERAFQVLSVNDYVDVNCIEITDHSNCLNGVDNNISTANQHQYGGESLQCKRDTPTDYPLGNHADDGINGTDDQNVSLTKVWIHGLGIHGIKSPRAGSWTLTNVDIENSPSSGWEFDDTTNGGLTGTFTLTDVSIVGSGCGESYPGLIRHHCFSQSQGGYGDAIGIGNESEGNWVLTNSNFSFNVSDGLDLLHGTTVGTLNVYRLRAEANAGAAFKGKANPVNIENSVILGNCAYWSTASAPVLVYSQLTSHSASSTCDNDTACEFNESEINCPNDCGGFNVCRPANQVSLSLEVNPGFQANINNSTITSNGDVLIFLGGNCDIVTKVKVRNTILVGGTDYNGGDVADLFYTEAPGCNDGNFDEKYNLIAQTKTYTTDCNDSSGTSTCYANASSLNLVGPIQQTTPYFTGTNYINSFYLTSTSPAIGANAADETITLTGTSNDYNNFNRGSQWDCGALEFGSVSGGGTQPTGGFELRGCTIYGSVLR